MVKGSFGRIPAQAASGFSVATTAKPGFELRNDPEDSDAEPTQCPKLERALQSTSANIQSTSGASTLVDAPLSKTLYYRSSPGDVSSTHSTGTLSNQDGYYYALVTDNRTNEKRRVWKPIPGALPKSRYEEYMSRQRRDIGSDGKEVWSDKMEEAFQIAVRNILPLGKKQVLARTRKRDPKTGLPGPLKKKLSGRNELISRKIEALTGEFRDRKQISSHLQVLQKFFRANNAWSTPAASRETSIDFISSKSLRWDEATCTLKVFESDPSSRTNTIKAEAKGYHKRSLLPTLRTSGTATSCSEISVQQIGFQMCFFPPEVKQDPKIPPVHRYSTMQSETGAQPRNLDEITDWRLYFPDLRAILENDGHHNTDIIFFDSSLELPCSPPMTGSQLDAQLNVDVRHNGDFDSWCARVAFYENKGQRLDPMLDKFDRSVDSRTLHTTHIDDQRTRLLTIPLDSTRWMWIFHDITQRRLQAFGEDMEREAAKWEQRGLPSQHLDNGFQEDATGSQQQTDAVTAEEEASREKLRELSIMQEVFIKRAFEPDTDSSTSERVAVFLWRFRQTRPGETATTTWRRLIRPSSFAQIAAPDSSLVQPPVLLSQNSTELSLNCPLEVRFTGVVQHQLLPLEHDWPSNLFANPSDASISLHASNIFHQDNMYPDPPQLEQAPPSIRRESIDQQHNPYMSQASSFSSQFSSREGILTPACSTLDGQDSDPPTQNAEPSTAMDQQVLDFEGSAYGREQPGADLTTQCTEFFNNAPRNTAGDFSSMPIDPHMDFSLQAIDESSLITDFAGGHIHINYSADFATEPLLVSALIPPTNNAVTAAQQAAAPVAEMQIPQPKSLATTLQVSEYTEWRQSHGSNGLPLYQPQPCHPFDRAPCAGLIEVCSDAIRAAPQDFPADGEREQQNILSDETASEALEDLCADGHHLAQLAVTGAHTPPRSGSNSQLLQFGQMHHMAYLCFIDSDNPEPNTGTSELTQPQELSVGLQSSRAPTLNSGLGVGGFVTWTMADSIDAHGRAQTDTPRGEGTVLGEVADGALEGMEF